MTYDDASNLAATYSNTIGMPLLNKLVFIDDPKITSLLVSPPELIKEVYSAWWHNGNNNEQAVTRNKKNKNFEVFLISYNPPAERVIYYLKLNKYIELGK
jgi:hypothetical protein